MWWCPPFSPPEWRDIGGVRGFCLSPRAVGSANAWLAVIGTQSLSTDYRNYCFSKKKIPFCSSHEPCNCEAFKPADAQMGFRCQALQNVVTQSSFPAAVGYVLKSKPPFWEVAAASSKVKLEKLEKPKGDFSLWRCVLLGMRRLCRRSCSADAQQHCGTRTQRAGRIREPCHVLLRRSRPGAESLVCPRARRGFHQPSGLADISVVKITSSGLLVWDFGT